MFSFLNGISNVGRWPSLGALLAAIAVGLTAPASAIPVGSCPATLTAGNYEITNPITCTAGNSITLQGGVFLDMRGYVVTCAGASIGIQMDGNGNRLFNGKVENCGIGAALAGTGGHEVEDVVFLNNTTHGINVDGGGNNKLVRVTSEASGGANFAVYGQRNRFEDCVAIGSLTDSGFSMLGTSRNVFERCGSSDNAQFGYSDNGGNFNRFAGNGAHGNGLQGFLVTSAQGDKLQNNWSTNNGNHGYEVINCTKCSLRGNMAETNALDGFVVNGGIYNQLIDNRGAKNEDGVTVFNGATSTRIRQCFFTRNSEKGIRVDSSGNFVTNNHVTNNDVGILIGASDNIITGNVVGGSVDFDLADTVSCNGNTWNNFPNWATKFDGCEN